MAEKLKASIGIMTFEGASRVKYLLRSIFKHTFEKSFRIIVYDDGSSEENQEALREYCKEFQGSGNLDLILAKENKGTRNATNRCMEYHDSKYGFVWADDLLATPGWLTNWIGNYEAFSKKIGIGFLGFQFPSFSSSIVNQWRGTGIVGFGTSPYGFLVGMEKKKYWAIGGLDERAHSFFEELELGAKCMDKGWHSPTMPKPGIPHFGSATWGKRGAKKDEKSSRYDEASELLQNEVFGRDWSIHEKYDLFMLQQQPRKDEEHALWDFNSYYSGERITVRVPKLIFRNYFEEMQPEKYL